MPQRWNGHVPIPKKWKHLHRIKSSNRIFLTKNINRLLLIWIEVVWIILVYKICSAEEGFLSPFQIPSLRNYRCSFKKLKLFIVLFAIALKTATKSHLNNKEIHTFRMFHRSFNDSFLFWYTSFLCKQKQKTWTNDCFYLFIISNLTLHLQVSSNNCLATGAIRWKLLAAQTKMCCCCMTLTMPKMKLEHK